MTDFPVVRRSSCQKIKIGPSYSFDFLTTGTDFLNFQTTGPTDKWDVSGNHHARGTTSKQSILLEKKLGSRKKKSNYKNIKAGVINHHSIQKI